MPVVTVLQLDTDFPRVPGDVACPDTYRGEIEIIRIPHATVGQVVRTRPDLIDITPFEDAVRRAQGEVIVTSCGFLSYWQDHLAGLADRPFISSALTALGSLCKTYAPHEILTLTFDADSLTEQHLGPYRPDVIGLPVDLHLRRVISENQRSLDVTIAEAEAVKCVMDRQQPHHKRLLLECTNLPPYKAALARQTGLPVSDILTCIEAARPGTIRKAFLS